MTTTTSTAEKTSKSKHFGIATLFTHEAVDMIGLDAIQSIEAQMEYSHIKIKCLNGNQTPEGLTQFLETYDDVMLVLADDKQGVMFDAAEKKGVTILNARDIPSIAKRSWITNTFI